MVGYNTHDCRRSLRKRRATLENPYRFVDSGLPNVYLAGIRYGICRVCGMQSADIPAVKNLMMLLGRTIVESDAPLTDRKSTRLNSSHIQKSRMPSSA